MTNHEIETIARTEEKIDSLIIKVDRLEYSINGNGTPGLKTRVDRIEQIVKVALWICGTVGTLMATGIGYIVVKVVFNAYGVKN